MSLELQSAEASAITALWSAWESATDSELEATFKSLDYTAFLDIIKYLRSLGLQEEPQPPKLNIIVAGGLRFTLVGEGVISAYCRDNTLKGKPFHVVLKEKKVVMGGASEVDLAEYDVRIKVRREHPVAKDDPRVMDVLTKWATIPKSFRHIKRYTFTSLHHKGVHFDASFVRENQKDVRGRYKQSTTFMGAAITKQPVHYEMEVEVMPGATQKSFMVGIASVLRGIQRSYVLTRKSVRDNVVGLMSAQTRAPRGRFPGTQPDTLKKVHIGKEPEADTAHLPTGDYNVTDKADGLRCLLVVDRSGRIYMVDRNLNVYGTDRRLDDAATAEWSGTVLDGEWITQDADNKAMSKYYAFDIFNGKGGEDVTGRPFIIRSETAVSRLAAMTEATSVLSVAGYVVAGIPKHHSLSIHMKTFQTADDPKNPLGIFKEAASVLDRVAKERPYHTDGLIFTPNAAPLPKNVSRWQQQLKWKPASQNSVDFLVITEKERDLAGKPTGVELVSTRLREDTQQIVRYKTLRLFVGSSLNPAFIDPRDTVLNQKPYPASTEDNTGDYRPVEFIPSPPDPMASICYVAINAGATDAAGAAPGAQALAAFDDAIYCEETKDPITNKTIVEMIYDPKKPAGWRWSPLRVRWDKTEKFSRNQIGGTLNSDGTANDTWISIHDPITEHMIRTGSTEEESDATEGTLTTATAYYQRKAPQRDLYKIRGLARFHNEFIKENTLLRTIGRGAAVLDMSVGQAGDIHKWIHQGAGFVLGTDIALTGLTDPKNGAYRRYLNKSIKTRGALPPMIFVQADSSVRYADGAAGQTPLDRSILRALWGENEPSAPALAQRLRGAAAGGFDVASLMFSLHYFFRDRSTLDGLLRNLSETVRVGGYFVGCCFDGDAVARLMKDVPIGGTKRGNQDGVDIWSITKKYSDDAGMLPATDDGLGKAIDVEFISIGESYTEYLVSWSYFASRIAEHGFDLLNPDEIAFLGLKQSTAMFSDSYKLASESGNTFIMSQPVKTFSFLNRWFIFRRRSTGTSASLTFAPAVPAVVPEAPAAAAAALAEAPATAALAEAPAAAALAEVPAAAAPAALADVPVVPVVPVENTSVEATGPIYQFYHKSAPKDDLKVGDKHWRRYLSTFAPFEFRDTMNPDIIYPSLEAALGAAKYQIATNKPELGQQLFSTIGNIHQKIEEEKRAIGKLSADQEAEFVEKEGTAMRDAQKAAYMRKVRATWNEEAWIESRERILTTYVRQRYEGDVKFRTILAAIAAQKAHLAYYVAGTSSELSGSIEGETIKGDNLYGRALMRVAGLRY